MNNESSEYFAGQRREIKEKGFIADDFLDQDPDRPVFGINLACAYPFPANVETSYIAMANRLAALDEEVYVYPLWETHVTVVTFLNFSLHQRPSAELLGELRCCIGPVIEVMKSLFDAEGFEPFRLEFQPPVLTRKAAILPVANPSGEITRIRQRARQLLEGNKGLHEKLSRGGLNAPGIIHSTIMRFKKAPRDLVQFSAGFDAIAAATAPFSITVPELFLTAETKPYMRGGEVMQRFPLAGAQRGV